MDNAGALALFRRLPAVTVDEMQGDWLGREVSTGHPMDGLLAASRWQGKRFDGRRAFPLVHDGPFGRVCVNPALVPLGLAVRLRMARWPLIGTIVPFFLPLVATRKPKARLEAVELEGVVSAAMIYDQKPITDHFRRIDADAVLGRMDRKGDAMAYFFILERA